MVLENKKKRNNLENKKKRNNLENNSVDLEEDRISNLPDALVHHILYFLPTKCAMSTCILSKRWKYLSNSIPTLDFRYWRTLTDCRKQKKLETRRFMNFMDTVLFLHDKPNIQKFYLDLDGFFDESRVNRWISTIMKHKVEEFGLSMMSLRSTSAIFPLSLFTCDSLTLLHLETWRILSQIIIPNAVSFPKLKILRLTYIDFVDETSARKFFSNCPSLEELSLHECSLYQELYIVNPTLKHLSITSCLLIQSTVKISAPNLLTIDFSCDLPGDFVLSNFPSLVEADVQFDINDGYDYNVFVKLFKKLSSAKLLKLCASSFQVPSEADIFLADFPAFNNLTHLEISPPFCYTRFGRESILTLRTFFRFLQLSPNLESIVFTESIHNPREEYDGCWSLYPICSLPHLKSIKFKYFDGEPVELDAIKLFMKCAGFLETVTIVASLGISKDHQLNATKRLLMFPRPANCVVKFLTISEDV